MEYQLEILRQLFIVKLLPIKILKGLKTKKEVDRGGADIDWYMKRTGQMKNINNFLFIGFLKKRTTLSQVNLNISKSFMESEPLTHDKRGVQTGRLVDEFWVIFGSL